MDINQIAQQSRSSQNKLEVRKVLQYVDEIHPQVILEIGAWRGYLMETWKQMWPTAMIIGIEIDEKNIDAQLNNSLSIIIGDSKKKETVENVRAALAGRKIDFLFLDGDHNYDAVKKDFELYSPLVRCGGVIGFHDIALDSNEWRMAGVDVQRFWSKELIAPAGSKYLEFWDQQGKGTGTGLYYKK